MIICKSFNNISKKVSKVFINESTKIGMKGSEGFSIEIGIIIKSIETLNYKKTIY